MLIAASVVAIIAGSVAVVLLTLRLPWPQRVHWLVATNALGCWGAPSAPITMREVFVVDVWTEGCRLNVVVRTSGSPPSDTTLVLAETPPLTTSAQVARWRAAGTSLLLVSDGSGRVSLHGPTRAVCGLRVPGAASSPTQSIPGDDAAPGTRQEVTPWPTA